MFEIGDGVMHPVHGAGIVTDISQETHFEEEDTFYVIQTLASDLRVMVPVDRAEEIGLSAAPERAEAKKVLSIVSAPAQPLPDDYKERQRILDSVLRSGCVLRKAAAFRDLAWREREHRKGLSSKETQLFRRLERFVSGEVALAEEMEFAEAKELIGERVNRSYWQATMSSQAS